MPHECASEQPRSSSGGGRASAQSQSEVIAFLSSPAAFPGCPAHIERYDTHGAVVFAGPDAVYKIKRAVRYPYMDFSTLELREAVIRREFALNAPCAPDLYIGVVAVTRRADGGLELGGDGPPVEWALHMRRFGQADLLSEVAARGALDRPLALAVADAIAASHARAPAGPTAGGAARIARVAEQVAAGLAAEPGVFSMRETEVFRTAANRQIERVSALLDRRAARGLVRRCHGDLHAANVVLWRGRPVLFDALEFDEDLATIDTFYDLAFILMDLDRCGARPAANLVLNRYLLASRDPLGVEALAALPLFLAMRAAVRAMVGAERAVQEDGAARGADVVRARSYLDLAMSYLAPPPPRLVAVGGFSGTGKSTLAMALAPALGAAPGALHIRADVERKALHGVEETVRLPPESYTREAAATVYAAMLDKARRALAAGHSAVVDAVFSHPGERSAVETVARETGAGFDGLWLRAPPAVIIGRVARRSGDASDATPEIAERQLERGAGDVRWTPLEAGGEADATLAAALAALGLQT